MIFLFYKSFAQSKNKQLFQLNQAEIESIHKSHKDSNKSTMSFSKINFSNWQELLGLWNLASLEKIEGQWAEIERGNDGVMFFQKGQ